MVRNLAKPLKLDDTEIDKFIQLNICAIHRSHLVKYPASRRRWTANCPKCGPIYEHNHMSKSLLETIVDAEETVKFELSRPTKEDTR